jgi:DNA-binding PadR family transcriptional regulator
VRPTRDKLTPGEWALLGLLDQKAAHGFALARAMAPDGEVGRIWSIRRTMVYSALDHLERWALVQPKATVPSDSGPRRTILEATTSGIAALNDWLQEPVERVRDARSLLMLKLLFLTRRGENVRHFCPGSEKSAWLKPTNLRRPRKTPRGLTAPCFSGGCTAPERSSNSLTRC